MCKKLDLATDNYIIYFNDTTQIWLVYEIFAKLQLFILLLSNYLLDLWEAKIVFI